MNSLTFPPGARKFLISRRALVLLIAVTIGLLIPVLLSPGYAIKNKRGNSRQLLTNLHREWWALTGGLIDVGGYYLRIECHGAGTPVVVMDAGMGMGMDTWRLVMPAVAKFTRVCVYDRAGIGASDQGPEPRTVKQTATELHELLERAKVKSPFLLVGHSFGALNIRYFAAHHAKDVAGMILVEPTNENAPSRVAAVLSPVERERQDLMLRGGNGEHIDSLMSIEQMHSSPPLPLVPLLVVTSAKENPRWRSNVDQLEKIRLEMQEQLVHLVPGGKQVVTKNTGHFVQLTDPEVVINAIRRMVMDIRRRG